MVRGAPLICLFEISHDYSGMHAGAFNRIRAADKTVVDNLRISKWAVNFDGVFPILLNHVVVDVQCTDVTSGLPGNKVIKSSDQPIPRDRHLTALVESYGGQRNGCCSCTDEVVRYDDILAICKIWLGKAVVYTVKKVPLCAKVN